MQSHKYALQSHSIVSFVYHFVSQESCWKSLVKICGTTDVNDEQ